MSEHKQLAIGEKEEKNKKKGEEATSGRARIITRRGC